MAVARGTRRIAADEPKVWFTSTESFVKVLSAGNRELLQVIAKDAPSSLDELARITGRAKSNLSRTLKTMESYGLIQLARGGGKGRITPKVTYDRVELDLPLIGSRDADQDRSGPKRGLRGGRACVASRVATPQPQSLNRHRIKRLRAVPTNRCRISSSFRSCLGPPGFTPHFS